MGSILNKLKPESLIDKFFFKIFLKTHNLDSFKIGQYEINGITLKKYLSFLMKALLLLIN